MTAPPDPSALGAPPLEPVLPVDDIQGDILAGFRKDHETFLFLRITDAQAAKRSLRELLPRVSPLCDVAMFNALFRSVCARRGELPGSMTATWLNVAFTASGLAALTGRTEASRFADRSFRLGLTRRSAFVGDPVDAASPGHPAGWYFGGSGNPVDAVVLIAADDAHMVDVTVAECEQLLTANGGGFEVAWRERCQAPPNLPPGHEHFGFKDGVSQPGVRGRLDEATYLAPRDVLPDPADPRSYMYGRPGQPLIWPGQFVLGLSRQSRSDTDPAPLPPLPVRPAWARHGSLLVIRRLRQDPDGFRRFVEASAEQLAMRPGFAGMTADRLAALVLGRWPSGAPLIRVPEADDPQLGAASSANNAFGYLNERPLPRPRPGVPLDTFPPALADPAGRVCPHGAHIRKMNPRDQPARGSGAGEALTHMVLRRGLTFDHTGDDQRMGMPSDKGLMFACYQSSIRQGFEFLTTVWANNRTRPRDDPGGLDLIVGRQAARVGAARRALVLIGQDNERVGLETAEHWVVPTGGGYFFAPSISALRDSLTR